MSITEPFWINPYYLPVSFTDALCQLIVCDSDIEDAEQRLDRFAPFLQTCFPETAPNRGRIESPLREIPAMQQTLNRTYGCTIQGKLFLKMDSHLPIAGSVKARGGIYEVLKHAEDLCLSQGLLTAQDSYERFADADIRTFLRQHTIQVGSTGNLGLSIGIMSAALGFNVKVHMSADARQWKKDLLRAKGVDVVEYSADYSAAVAEGRRRSDADPASYFIDDEKSIDLFLGYATAAKRLQRQLQELGIPVDEEHPLIVTIPAGVGGAPGGIAYGLKRVFRDHVHCFFAEPAACPSVMLGISTQTFEQANVRNYGLSGETAADGLACASPSGFVTRIMTNLVSGGFTVSDGQLYEYLRQLHRSEGILIEPSACAAFAGPCGFSQCTDYCSRHGLSDEKLAQGTHIAWATGGSMVPQEEYDRYLNARL